jgi:hypothetical protein
MNALILALNLLCTTPYYGTTYHVEALVKSQTEYQVILRDSRMEEMEMFRSELKFDELGLISEIETHHMVENFEVHKTAAGWEGLYQYDLAYYPLKCSEQ